MRSLYLILIALLMSGAVRSQEHMINGGFETVDVNVLPEPGYGYSIRYAPPWNDIAGSCDLFHPGTPDFGGSTTPHSGSGCARIGHYDEYGVGRTDALTAGQSYDVSFWVKHGVYTNQVHDFGVFITPEEPVSGVYNIWAPETVPQAKIDVVSQEWTKVSYCFTASVSGVHYLVFGSRGEPELVNEPQMYYIDDVSVYERSATPQDPTATINLPTTVCAEDNIVADGSGSTNETLYQWELYRVLLSGSEEIIDGTPLQSGQAAQFDITSALGGVEAQPLGRCYNLVLWTQNGCFAQDAHIFCFDDPRVFFVDPVSVVCENVPIELEVTGDDGWLYEWSTGLTGTGEKTATVTPTAPSATYSVTVTTPAGCQHTETLTLTVSSLNGQVPPTMDGIDGTNGYTYYVNAGGFVDFTSTVFNNSGEIVTITPPTTLPPNISVDLPPLGSNGGTVTFEGQPGIGSEGVYDIILAMEDNNGCLVESNTYTFQIIVVCPTCPICWDYENRTPDHNPLAPENRMAKCILAGFTEPVIIGQGNHVLFQAGESIELSNNYFDTDGGTYDAIIEPTTCIDECNDCCDNWQGFTYDYIPPTVYINPWDDDPTNDFWQLTDIEHPLCSFGITGYRLVIASIEEDNIEDREYHTDHCCAFQTPSADWPWIEHSEIWWDNLNHQGPNQNEPVQPGDFIVHLWLYGCNGQEDLLEIHVTLYHNEYNMAPIGDDETETADNEAREQLQQQLAITEELKGEITLFPNPANDRITVQGLIEPNATVQLYDAKGVMLTGKTALDASGSYDVSKLSAGTYYLRVYSKGGYVAKRFEKL